MKFDTNLIKSYKRMSQKESTIVVNNNNYNINKY